MVVVSQRFSLVEPFHKCALTIRSMQRADIEPISDFFLGLAEEKQNLIRELQYYLKGAFVAADAKKQIVGYVQSARQAEFFPNGVGVVKLDVWADPDEHADCADRLMRGLIYQGLKPNQNALDILVKNGDDALKAFARKYEAQQTYTTVAAAKQAREMDVRIMTVHNLDQKMQARPALPKLRLVS